MAGTELLNDLLRDVSRSFYLTLRALPRRVRAQIGCAYLLARATDTVADTALLPVEARANALERLRLFISGSTDTPPDLDSFAPASESSTPASEPIASPSPAEQQLVLRIAEVVALLNQFSEQDQSLIRAVLDTITQGQLLDLRRFAYTDRGEIRALQSDAELDDYLYRVAGCVGEFWTQICRSHLFPNAPLDDAFLLGNGVRYGKGLQLTNVLRDLPVDLLSNRCYLPRSRLREHGLAAVDLLKPAANKRVAPVLEHYRQVALGHLKAGWDYTNHLPWRHVRIRLACAWPILIGKRTLELLGKGYGDQPGRKVKVSRVQVRRIVAKTILMYPFRRQWIKQWDASGVDAS